MLVAQRPCWMWLNERCINWKIEGRHGSTRSSRPTHAEYFNFLHHLSSCCARCRVLSFCPLFVPPQVRQTKAWGFSTVQKQDIRIRLECPADNYLLTRASSRSVTALVNSPPLIFLKPSLYLHLGRGKQVSHLTVIRSASTSHKTATISLWRPRCFPQCPGRLHSHGG